jgi:hypothetical protein
MLGAHRNGPKLTHGAGPVREPALPKKSRDDSRLCRLDSPRHGGGSGAGFRGRVLLVWFLFCLLFCFPLFSAFLRLQQFFF